MRKKQDLFDKALQRSRFPVSLFGMYFVILLLMTGVHMGILVLMEHVNLNTAVECIIAILYWVVVAGGITWFTRGKVKNTYEEPMQSLAEATTKVANGDFSVYIPTLHTSDKLDYLDIMILDFNKMVEQLGSIETLKTDFVSNVSHEMKTPIAIIKNYAEMLRRDDISEEERKEYAAAIEHAAVRLSSLISNILKLNKLENQSIVIETEQYDVCRQVCDCILQFEELWDKKEIELDVDMEDEAFIYADESLMEMVWNNLLSNAIKFTEQGGSITVKQITEDEYVKISVSDTGCGMNKECVNRIFDKFYQGDTSHSKEGNGLGLALVKRVLELMDGDIQVVSEEGVGSTFTVTLLKADSENEREA